MKILLILMIIGCSLGLSLMLKNYISSEKRDKPEEKREKGFTVGLVLTIFCVCALCYLFNLKGSANKPIDPMDKKEMAFMVEKKLKNHRVKILNMDEGTMFIISGDDIFPETRAEPEPLSLSDVKTM